MSRLRHSKVSKPTIPTITLTPLIDTVLVLLVVFMVTSPCKIITLPAPGSKKNQTQKIPSEAYRVSYMYVSGDGSVSVNGAHQDQRSVIKKMGMFVAQSPIKTVFIKAEDSAAASHCTHCLVDAIHNIPGARVIVS